MLIENQNGVEEYITTSYKLIEVKGQAPSVVVEDVKLRNHIIQPSILKHITNRPDDDRYNIIIAENNTVGNGSVYDLEAIHRTAYILKNKVNYDIYKEYLDGEEPLKKNVEELGKELFDTQDFGIRLITNDRVNTRDVSLRLQYVSKELDPKEIVGKNYLDILKYICKVFKISYYIDPGFGYATQGTISFLDNDRDEIIRNKTAYHSNKVFRYKMNISDTNVQWDISDLKTYVRGRFKSTDPLLDYEIKEFTSPLAETFGILEHEEVEDLNLAGWQADEFLKYTLDSTFDISINLDITELEGHNSEVKLGDIVRAVDERNGIEEDLEVIKKESFYNFRNELQYVNITVGRPSLSERYVYEMDSDILDEKLNDLKNEFDDYVSNLSPDDFQNGKIPGVDKDGFLNPDLNKGAIKDVSKHVPEDINDKNAGDKTIRYPSIIDLFNVKNETPIFEAIHFENSYEMYLLQAGYIKEGQSNLTENLDLKKGNLIEDIAQKVYSKNGSNKTVLELDEYYMKDDFRSIKAVVNKNNMLNRDLKEYNKLIINNFEQKRSGNYTSSKIAGVGNVLAVRDAKVSYDRELKKYEGTMELFGDNVVRNFKASYKAPKYQNPSHGTKVKTSSNEIINNFYTAEDINKKWDVKYNIYNNPYSTTGYTQVVFGAELSHSKSFLIRGIKEEDVDYYLMSPRELYKTTSHYEEAKKRFSDPFEVYNPKIAVGPVLGDPTKAYSVKKTENLIKPREGLMPPEYEYEIDLLFNGYEYSFLIILEVGFHEGYMKAFTPSERNIYFDNKIDHVAPYEHENWIELRQYTQTKELYKSLFIYKTDEVAKLLRLGTIHSSLLLYKDKDLENKHAIDIYNL